MKDKLTEYSKMIHGYSSKFNLTGLTDLRQVESVLVYDSLKPFETIDVPRGTSIVDAGSGAGVPGIPLSIEYPEASFLLIEASSKKVDFINHVIRELDLSNVEVLNSRIEEAAVDPAYREKFDLAVSRAVGSVYMMSELCSGLVACGGGLLLYKNIEWDTLNDAAAEHAAAMGLVFDRDISAEFLYLKKISSLSAGYPRRYAVVKRNDVMDESV